MGVRHQGPGAHVEGIPRSWLAPKGAPGADLPISSHWAEPRSLRHMGQRGRGGHCLGLESGLSDCRCPVVLPQSFCGVSLGRSNPFLPPRPHSGLCWPSPAELSS